MKGACSYLLGERMAARTQEIEKQVHELVAMEAADEELQRLGEEMTSTSRQR